MSVSCMPCSQMQAAMLFLSVLSQAVDGPDDLRPKAYTSGSFSETQQRWSATEKQAFAVCPSVWKCILHCDLKPLEPFWHVE